MNKRKIIIVTGATASGKTSKAIEMAQQVDGVIINADSMQLYRDLHIITARPSDSEMKQAKHELYGVIDGSVNCNIAMWIDMAKEAIESAWEKGKQPIVTGGTGMYLSGLMKGVSYIPDIDNELRHRLREKIRVEGNEAFYRYLQTIDAASAARLEVNDTQRMLRAAEVMEQTGKSITYWQAQPVKPTFDNVEFEIVIVQMERSKLYNRINRRFDLMIEQGAIEEVAALKKRNLPQELPIMRAVGVPELIAYLDGKMSLDEAVEKAKQYSRNYAKRQLTWIRNQFKDHMSS